MSAFDDFPPATHLTLAQWERHKAIGDALDVLRSDWDEDHGPTPAQALALDEARHHIGRAKTHLDRAAR